MDEADAESPYLVRYEEEDEEDLSHEELSRCIAENAPSALLGPLLDEWRDVFVAEVLARLDPTACAVLAQVGKLGRWRRALGRVAAGAGLRLPTARGASRHAQAPPRAGIWTHCGGRGITTARGVFTRVYSPRKAGTWEHGHCSGRGSTAARGM